MANSKGKLTTRAKGKEQLIKEAGESRIMEAVREHMLRDVGGDLNAISFGLDFSLDIGW